MTAPALQRLLARRAGAPAPWLHQEVGRRMAERLPLIRLQPRRIIDWWGAAGGAGALLAAQYPQAQRISVEPACQLAAARAPVRWWSRLGWHRAPAVQLAAEPEVAALAPVQLVWANMVLHWIDDVPALLSQWHAAMHSDGFLMFSCFGPDTLRQLRGLYGRQGWGPAASDFTDLHDLGDALVHAGFADPVMDMEMLHLSWPTAAALLAELRALGANTSPRRFAGWRTPRWRARLEAQIEAALQDRDGRPGLSFEIVYGHAFKPAPRVRAQPRTEVSLDTMRALLKDAGGGRDGSH